MFLPLAMGGLTEIHGMCRSMADRLKLHFCSYCVMFQPTMVQWVELLTKQFNASQAACEWFLDHMAHSEWWPVQILIKCPNQMVRQMFQRLCIHVIQRLRLVIITFSDSVDLNIIK